MHTAAGAAAGCRQESDGDSDVVFVASTPVVYDVDSDPDLGDVSSDDDDVTIAASAADRDDAQLQGNWHTWQELREIHTGRRPDVPHPEPACPKCELPIAAVCPSSGREDVDEDDYATSGATVFPCGAGRVDDSGERVSRKRHPTPGAGELDGWTRELREMGVGIGAVVVVLLLRLMVVALLLLVLLLLWWWRRRRKKGRGGFRYGRRRGRRRRWWMMR